MITTEMIYWLVMLDNITKAIFVLACVIGLGLFIYTAAIADGGYDLHPIWYPFMWMIEIMLILAAIFVPNSKQMAAIYIIPRVVNNERIQAIGDKTLDAGDKVLALAQQYIEEKLNKKEQK